MKGSIKDACAADEDDEIGREKEHDELLRIFQAVGGKQKGDPPEQKERRNDSDQDVSNAQDHHKRLRRLSRLIRNPLPGQGKFSVIMTMQAEKFNLFQWDPFSCRPSLVRFFKA